MNSRSRRGMTDLLVLWSTHTVDLSNSWLLLLVGSVHSCQIGRLGYTQTTIIYTQMCKLYMYTREAFGRVAFTILYEKIDHVVTDLVFCLHRQFACETRDFTVQ